MVHFKNIQKLLPWHTLAPRADGEAKARKDHERPVETCAEMDKQGKDLFRYRYRWKWWDQRDATKSVSRMHCVAEVICTFVTLIWRTVAHFAKVSSKPSCQDVWLLKCHFSCLMFLTLACSLPHFAFERAAMVKRRWSHHSLQSVYSLQRLRCTPFKMTAFLLLQKPVSASIVPQNQLNEWMELEAPALHAVNNKGDKASRQTRSKWNIFVEMVAHEAVKFYHPWNRPFWGRLPWPTYSNLHRNGKWCRSYPWLPFLQKLGTPEFRGAGPERFKNGEIG